MKKLLVVVGLFIFGIFMLVVGFKSFSESKKLQKDGKSAVATVVDGEERRGRRGRKSYSLTVSFATEAGQTMQGKKSVSRELYEQASSTRQAPVVYLPSDPTKFRITTQAKSEFIGLIVGAGALIGSVITFFSRSQGA